MLHLFHLGPLAVGEQRLWLLSGVDERGRFVHPLVGADLPSGLAAFSARLGARELRAGTALEGVAARFGIAAEPLPDCARVPRAVLAFAFLTSHRLFRKLSAVGAFLEACSEFRKGAPWTRLPPGEPCRIVMAQGWRCWDREFVVRGSGNEPRGLELHARAGFVQRARGAGSSPGVRPPRIDSLLVTFEPGPSWALEAVHAAYGLTELPTVIRLQPGSRQPPGPGELLQLAAALRSTTLLDVSPNYGAQVALSADGYEVDSVAVPPTSIPATVTAARPASETPRNAFCPCGSGRKFKRCHLTHAGVA
jgi:SEC-C motif